MIKEIKEKVEAKREDIKSESRKLREEATKNHTCANCGKPLPPGKRTYCSDSCSYEFASRFDYSVNSKTLKEYREKLKSDYDIMHPKKERQPWSSPVARKEHGCSFCGTKIKRGEKHEMYVRLPEYDMSFNDNPYEVLRYHTNCLRFMSILYDSDLIDEEGFSDDEAFVLLCEIALETEKSFEETVNNIISGNFPSIDFLKKLLDEYGFELSSVNLWDSDHSGYQYIYAVKYESFNKPMSEIYISLFEIKDPSNYFANYYESMNGEEFNRIVSVKWIKVPLPEIGV